MGIIIPSPLLLQEEFGDAEGAAVGFVRVLIPHQMRFFLCVTGTAVVA